MWPRKSIGGKFSNLQDFHTNWSLEQSSERREHFLALVPFVLTKNFRVCPQRADLKPPHCSFRFKNEILCGKTPVSGSRCRAHSEISYATGALCVRASQSGLELFISGAACDWGVKAREVLVLCYHTGRQSAWSLRGVFQQVHSLEENECFFLTAKEQGLKHRERSADSARGFPAPLPTQAEKFSFVYELGGPRNDSSKPTVFSKKCPKSLGATSGVVPPPTRIRVPQLDDLDENLRPCSVLSSFSSKKLLCIRRKMRKECHIWQKSVWTLIKDACCLFSLQSRNIRSM